MYSVLNSHELLKSIRSSEKLLFIEYPQKRERLTCVICKHILLEPYQSQCGCRFCYSCIKDEKNILFKNCPGCGDRFGSNNSDLMHDKAIEKEILELPLSCVNISCEYKCKLKNLRNHLEICAYKTEKCISCGDLYAYLERDQHKSIYCKIIKVKCNDCGLEMTKKDLNEKHRSDFEHISGLCEFWKGVCPYKCSEEIQENVKLHLHDCKNLPVECIMKEVGCIRKMRREDMEGHVREEVSFHLRLIMESFLNFKKENEEIKSEFKKMSEIHESEIDKLTLYNTENCLKIKTLSKEINSCENKYINLQKEANVIRMFYAGAPSSTEVYGEHTWLIKKIVDKIESAKKGINTQIFSEPFYTSNRGYKMFLKIYPNGDGKGAGNNLSIYFVIAKGEYDNEIAWPFTKKISVTLLHNETNGNNKIINMRPDSNKDCYGKPSKEYNLAAGQPNFISHVDLIGADEFVKDGSITVMAKVF